MCNISKQSGLTHLLRDGILIIWDEAPMMKREPIESLDTVLQEINTIPSEELCNGTRLVCSRCYKCKNYHPRT